MEKDNGILVLMSTYNGEKYLRQQIDSILGQQGVAVKLLVRDDGSHDATLSILDEYKEKGLLDYYQGENLGPARSFMHLLQNAPASDYYAFADQDDVWLPEKLSVAVNNLSEHEYEPALYFCQTQLVDEKLNGLDNIRINPKLTFEEALIYQFVGGCTMVLNRNARDVVSTYSPKFLCMHDTWIYTVILAVGGYVHFDATPHILYRQHGNNAVGQGDRLRETRRSLKRFCNNENERYHIAKEVKNGFYISMPQEHKISLDLFLQAHDSLSSKIKIITNRKMRSGSKRTNFLFWTNVLLNRL